jgi:hypothetical protein
MSRAPRLFLLPLLLLLPAGCPDPAGTTASTPAVELPAGAEGTSGTPGAEAVGGTPKEGSAGAPSAIAAPPVGFVTKEGEGVKVVGTLSYPGAKTGRIRIDFLRMSATQPPQLAHTVELPKFGAWSVTAPKDFGDLRVVGFLDQTGDGPSRDDPAFAWPSIVTVATDTVEGIELVLSDSPDLGELTPGGRPPAGMGAPAGGAAGPAPGVTPPPPPEAGPTATTAATTGQPIEGTPQAPPDAAPPAGEP